MAFTESCLYGQLLYMHKSQTYQYFVEDLGSYITNMSYVIQADVSNLLTIAVHDAQ